MMYDVEGTEGWHPGHENVYQDTHTDRHEAHMQVNSHSLSHIVCMKNYDTCFKDELCNNNALN